MHPFIEYYWNMAIILDCANQGCCCVYCLCCHCVNGVGSYYEVESDDTACVPVAEKATWAALHVPLSTGAAKLYKQAGRQARE
jgi:hypothetical protein